MKKIILCLLLTLSFISKINAQTPANDNCSNAISLTVGATCTAGTTVNSTFDASLPSCGGTTTNGNVWYMFIATSALTEIAVTNVIGFDPVLSTYNTCGGASSICRDNGNANDPEFISMTTVIGTSYYINIKQYGATAGTFCVAVNNLLPPVNDNCSNATNIAVGAACLTGTTVNSSHDGILPSCAADSTGNV